MELESEAVVPLSDMERDAFLETILELKENVQATNDMIKSLQATIRILQSELDRSLSHSERYQALIADLRSVIADLQIKLDEREREVVVLNLF